MGLGETLRQALAKLVVRAAGDQVKTACGNLQMCAGLKAGIEAENACNTSKAASRELVDSLLGGSVLHYVGHRACVRKASQTARLSKRSVEISDIFKR